jgi:hypothetical protein
MANKPKSGVVEPTAGSADSTRAKPRAVDGLGDGLGLDARSLEAIGRSLKAHYEDIVRAPVPGKFLEMLDRLEATEQSKPEGGSNEAG